MRENVIVPLNEDQFVAFRHHILFDYATSRVYLRADDLTHTTRLLQYGGGRGLMLAPALGFVLQQLWNDAENKHRHFWDAIVRFSVDPACDPVARSVAARTASELPRISGDAIGLLAGLEAQDEPKKPAVTALRHVIGALMVRLDDKQPVTLDPWYELASRAAEHVEETAWPLRTLLYALYEHITTEADRAHLGIAARRLLAYCLDLPNITPQLTVSAVDFVAVTYASDISASRKLLRRLFEPEHFQSYADQEIPWLARRIKHVSEVDPDFVTEIYAEVFSREIADRSSRPIGQSQILPLSTARNQAYQSAEWSLKEFFPQFLMGNPLSAVRALIGAISGYIARAHPMNERTQVWNVSTPNGIVHLKEDRSCIWAWDINGHHGDNANGLIKAFGDHLEAVEPDVARVMVQEIITRNELGVLWARTLMIAAKRAKAIGDLLWPIATQQPFLKLLDTQKDSIDFIAARYPFEETASRMVFERMAIGFSFEPSGLPEARHDFLTRLFTCVGEQNLATREARDIITKEGATESPSPFNPRPFSFSVRTGSPDKWYWLKGEGVDLNNNQVTKILTETDKIKEALGIENRDQEITDVLAAIDLVKTLVDMAVLEGDKLPESVLAHAYAVAAQGLAKLSHLTVERLLEQDLTVPSLIALVCQLAEVPAKPVSAKDEGDFESFAGWGSANTRVHVAEATMMLCRVGRSVVEKLLSLIEMFLDVQNHPAVRLQISDYLAVLWNSDRALMWELADRLARTEPNRGVLRFFIGGFLHSTMHADPERVELLAFCVHGRTFNRAEEATKELFTEIGSLIVRLWISYGRAKPWRAIRAWIVDPHTFKAELTQAIITSREALVLKYREEASENEDITKRAQEFCILAVTAMAYGWERYVNDAEKRPPTEDEEERGNVYNELLNYLCDEIYFASGAFRSSDSDKPLLETDEMKRGFLSDVRPALARIADVGTPSTIYHLVELLDFLMPADPAGVFDLVAHALLIAGRRHGYQFESLGANRFVDIVGRYLADYRDLFADEQRRQKLIECLDTFMEAGWPAARRLLYRLPELLQ
ncbi:MAG: hypothetical protein CSYNP_03659 [Syntrophus sp. SKADARSKE-3]|nr:hypothetical protein [Syntrophus sp. SKADARSKE-3]